MPQPLPQTNHDRRVVAAIEAHVLQGLSAAPGVKDDWDWAKRTVIPVHDQLSVEMARRISGVGRKQLVSSLYDELERSIAHRNRFEGHLRAFALLTGDPKYSRAIFAKAVESGPRLTALQYLIERAIDAAPDMEESPSRRLLGELIAIAVRFVELDFFLDAVYHTPGRYEAELTEWQGLRVRTSPRGRRARERWLRALEETMFIDQRNSALEQDELLDHRITDDEAFGNPDTIALDQAMKSELGYGIRDLFEVVRAAIRMIDDQGLWRLVVPKSELLEFLRSKTNLNEQVLNKIVELKTRRPVVRPDSDKEAVYPIQHYWRESRLLRRPFVTLGAGDDEIVVVGVEILSAMLPLQVERIMMGRETLPGSSDRGPIRRTVGAIQSRSGAPFRDQLANVCRDLGCVAEIEQLPPGMKNPPVGPVDLLVTDPAHHRFIAVECKALDPAKTPREVADQRKAFVGTSGSHSRTKPHLAVLGAKRTLFAEHVEEMMRSRRIESDRRFSVEGVLVLGHPAEWVYMEPDDTPILTDSEFATRLRSGSAMVQRSGSGLLMPDSR